MADRYERSVAANTPTLGFVSPQSFGAGLADALYAVGNIEERIREKEKRQRDDDQAAEFNVRFAQARDEEERAAVDAKTAAPEGGAGHSEAIRKRWDTRRQQLLEGITSERVRNYATERLAAWGSEFQSREYAWEQGRRVEKLGSDVDRTIDISANRARRAIDASAFGEELDEFENGVELLSVPADLKSRLVREGRDRIARSFLEGMNGRDPRQAQALLESGVFDEYLKPETLDILRGEAGVEIRREETEQRAALAAEKAQAREDINVFQKQLADGVPVKDEDIQRVQGLAQKYGFDGEVYDLGKARIINNANRVYRAATPIQLDQRVKELDASIAGAGDKAKPEQVIERDHLRTLLTQRSEELKSDPLDFGARGLGMRIDPIDFNDPASLQRRAQSARAVANATGAPIRLLTNEEAEILSVQAAAGGAGRRSVAEQLARLGARDALIAARQVAGEDEVLQRAVTLGPNSRALALAGPEYAEKNPKLVPKEESSALYERIVSRSLRHLGGEFDGATLETARNIYAGFAGRKGYAGEFRPDWFGTAINMALGTTKRGAEWQGGLGQYNGRKILLPTTMTQREFDTALTRINRPLQGASTGTPVWGDGSPIKASQVLTQFTPVAVRDGVYRFETARGDVLLQKGGGPWLLDVRKLGR
jgi:hypothetical protein